MIKMIFSAIRTFLITFLKVAAFSFIVWNWDRIIPNPLYSRYSIYPRPEKSPEETLHDAKELVLRVVKFLQTVFYIIRGLARTTANTTPRSEPERRPSREIPTRPNPQPRQISQPRSAGQIPAPTPPPQQQCLQPAKRCQLIEAQCTSYEKAYDEYTEEKFQLYWKEHRRAEDCIRQQYKAQKRHEAELFSLELEIHDQRTTIRNQKAEIHRLNLSLNRVEDEKAKLQQREKNYLREAYEATTARSQQIANLQGKLDTIEAQFWDAKDELETEQVDHKEALSQYDEQLKFQRREFATYWRRHNTALARLTVALCMQCRRETRTPELMRAFVAFKNRLRLAQKVQRSIWKGERADGATVDTDMKSCLDDGEGEGDAEVTDAPNAPNAPKSCLQTVRTTASGVQYRVTWDDDIE